MQKNMKEYRQLMSYCARAHKKDSVVRQVVEIIASVKLKRESVISTKKIKLICKSRGFEVSSSYIRQIFFRLVEKGILLFSEASSTGKRLILFCSKGVTRLLKNNLLDSKKLIKKNTSKQIGHKKPYQGGFLDHKPSNKQYIEINPITKKRTIKEIEIKQHNNKRLLSTRLFQTENFRASFKKMQREMNGHNYGEY